MSRTLPMFQLKFGANTIYTKSFWATIFRPMKQPLITENNAFIYLRRNLKKGK